MHRLFSIIFSLFLLCLETTSGNQLAAAGGRGDDNKCLDKERLALLQFKSGLQDNGCLSTWTAEEEDCCDLWGVTCHKQSGHVTELDLINCHLVGKISHSLLNLTYLNYIDLSFNSFHGTIPKFIGSMTQLKHIDLSDNSFSGTVPPELGNLTNLQYLFLIDVGRCRVENIEWLSHLSHLEQLILSLRKLSVLYFDRCELSEVMHPHSSSFLNFSSSFIEFLYLSNNSLNSSMYPWLFPLTSNKLRYLDLSRNMLDGIPRCLGNLCSLKNLYNLSGCTSLALRSLYAYDSQFTGSLPDEILKFPSLTELDLSQNQLNGTISEKLWEMPNLHTLQLSSNYLRGAISENIGKSKLSYVYLSKNSLQGVPSSYHMSNLSYIKEIDLRSCKLGPHFPNWIQNLKNLTILNLANTGISDTIPLEFWDMWPHHLQHLDLSSNNISGKVPDLLSNFNNYSAIDLSSNRFDGPIPNVSSTVFSLNLSKNNFSGGISFLCQIVDGFLVFLDLSQNFLSL